MGHFSTWAALVVIALSEREMVGHRLIDYELTFSVLALLFTGWGERTHIASLKTCGGDRGRSCGAVSKRNQEEKKRMNTIAPLASGGSVPD